MVKRSSILANGDILEKIFRSEVEKAADQPNMFHQLNDKRLTGERKHKRD